MPRRGADVLLVLDETAGQRRGDEHERRRPVELRRLLRAADLLQPGQRLRPEHAEAPRLREVVVRRQPGEVEQLKQRLARNRVRPELLVRPPGRTSSGKSNGSAELRGDDDVDARALEQVRERAALVGLGDGGLETPSSSPSTVRALDVRRDDLVALALDLVHHDQAGDGEPAGRRARLRQLARERHGEAAAVRGREQLLRACLALGGRCASGARTRAR